MSMRRRIAANITGTVDKQIICGQKNIRRCKCGREFNTENYSECPHCAMEKVSE